MTTFSQIVDSMVQEYRRPENQALITNFANQTIRELHSAKAMSGPANSPVLYAANLKEATVTPDVESGFGWDIPNPQNFQKLAAVRYDAFGNTREAYARERLPVNMFIESRHDKIYYRTGMGFSFAGYGGIGSTISLAWYEVPRRLKYYVLADRPATWNVDDDDSFTYITEYAGTDNLKAEARLLSTNWICDRWEELLMQGIRAKLFARLGDTARAPIAYSLFESMRPDMVMAESATDGNRPGESN